MCVCVCVHLSNQVGNLSSDESVCVGVGVCVWKEEEGVEGGEVGKWTTQSRCNLGRCSSS